MVELHRRLGTGGDGRKEENEVSVCLDDGRTQGSIRIICGGGHLAER